jgi:hypothetical protein
VKRGPTGQHVTITAAGGEAVRAFVPRPLPPRSPLLYLSLYLKQHRADYYRHLDETRLQGDWESNRAFAYERYCRF